MTVFLFKLFCTFAILIWTTLLITVLPMSGMKYPHWFPKLLGGCFVATVATGFLYVMSLIWVGF